MKNIYRVRILPRGPWRTPWQADTISGLLCSTCARTFGEAQLRTRLIEPMLGGEPPFVLSDACPGDLFPVPAAARLADTALEHRKTVKRARWMTRGAFDRIRRGILPSLDELVPDAPIMEHTRIHNTLARGSMATTVPSGSLFALTEFHLDHRRTAGSLSVYVRVRPDARELLVDLLEQLASSGFGADASAGMGAFDVSDPVLQPADDLTAAPQGADGLVVLSTFQPAPNDPIAGSWVAFTKFGKLGPDFGAADVRKNPLVMLRPGASFLSRDERLFLGHAIPMDEALPQATANSLRAVGIETIHPAFGLAIAAKMPISAGVEDKNDGIHG